MTPDGLSSLLIGKDLFGRPKSTDIADHRRDLSGFKGPFEAGHDANAIVDAIGQLRVGSGGLPFWIGEIRWLQALESFAIGAVAFRALGLVQCSDRLPPPFRLGIGRDGSRSRPEGWATQGGHQQDHQQGKKLLHGYGSFVVVFSASA